jgi:hypothetical protein
MPRPPRNEGEPIESANDATGSVLRSLGGLRVLAERAFLVALLFEYLLPVIAVIVSLMPVALELLRERRSRRSGSAS